MLALAVIAGATLPPVTSLARAALSSSLTAERRERAFGLESAVASAASPLCVGVAHSVAPVGPLALCGGLLIASSVGYTIAAAPTSRLPSPPGRPTIQPTERAGAPCP